MSIGKVEVSGSILESFAKASFAAASVMILNVFHACRVVVERGGSGGECGQERPRGRVWSIVRGGIFQGRVWLAC